MRRAPKPVNIAEAKARLSELVQRATLGEEVIIAKDNRPLVRLVPIRPSGGKRQPGSARGQIRFIARDFDTIPEGFEEYVP